MVKESCISHAPKTRSVIIKSDFLQICEDDHCEAALLSLVEFWANGALANSANPPNRVELGKFTSKDLHWWLLGFYSTKRIMQRVDKLKQRGFIDFEESANHKERKYWVLLDAIQSALDQCGQMSQDKCLCKKQSRHLSEENLVTPDKCLNKTESVQTNVSTSIFSNSSLISKKEELVTPLTPQGETNESTSDSVGLLKEEPIPPPSQESNGKLAPLTSKTNSGLGKNSARRVATNPKRAQLSEEELQYFLAVYKAEKPSNFVEHRALAQKHIKVINKLVAEYSTRSLEIFAAALIWVREQRNDWWRKEAFSLDNLISNGKLIEYADKHFFAIENDQAYCDRVEGRARSQDKGRNNGFSILDENGKQMTGASADCAEAVANDAILQFFLEAKI